MYLPLFLAGFCTATQAPDTASVRLYAVVPHLRIGLHASAHDISPLLGAEFSAEHFGASFDGWIRPFYWKTLEQQSPTRWTQYRILRYGFEPSIFVLLGDRNLGLMPMVGLDLVFGDISGSAHSPQSESNPWFGAAVAFAKHQRLGMRIATKEGVLGWVRGEWVAAL